MGRRPTEEIAGSARLPSPRGGHPATPTPAAASAARADPQRALTTWLAVAVAFALAGGVSSMAGAVDGHASELTGTKLASETSTSANQNGLECGSAYWFGIESLNAAANRSARKQGSAATSACASFPGRPPPASRGTRYYVAQGGRDGNPGTFGAPLATIQAGLNKLHPGDTLVLRGGTYFPAATLYLPRSGTSANAISVEAYPGETPVIDGGGRLTVVFRLMRGWVTIRRLTVQNTRQTSMAIDEGFHVAKSSDIVLDQVVVKDASRSIRIAASASRIAVSRCDVSGGVTGLYIAGHDVVVKHCNLHDLNRMANDGFDCDDDPDTRGDHGGQAIATVETSGPIEIRNNVAWNNRALSKCYGIDGAFVELYRSQNVDVHHNYSRRNVVTFETSGDTSGVRLWRNTIKDESFLSAHQANEMVVANNTAWNSTVSREVLIWVGGGTQFGNGSTSGLKFVNNALASTTGILRTSRNWDASATVNHNIYYSLTAGWFGMIGSQDFDTFATYQKRTGRDAASGAWNPLFVDPVRGNFQLQPGSPSIDRGVFVPGITRGFRGRAPDIGATESQEAAP